MKDREKLLLRLDGEYQTLAIFAMFFVGIYGGFIQAGKGVFIMTALSFLIGVIC